MIMMMMITQILASLVMMMMISIIGSHSSVGNSSWQPMPEYGTSSQGLMAATTSQTMGGPSHQFHDISSSQTMRDPNQQYVTGSNF